MFYGVSYRCQNIPLGFPEITLKMRPDLPARRLLVYSLNTQNPLALVSRSQVEPLSRRILLERYRKTNYPLSTSISRAASMTKEQEQITNTIIHSKNMF